MSSSVSLSHAIQTSSCLIPTRDNPNPTPNYLNARASTSPTTMAAQSKLHVPPVVSESLIKRAAKDIANVYIKNRTRITRTVYLTLFVALIERIRHAISEQKAASASSTDRSRSNDSSRTQSSTHWST